MPSDEDLTRARLLDGIETDLADVELALARLDAGTYFTCEACGADLPETYLAAHPTARRCADHAIPPAASPSDPAAADDPAGPASVTGGQPAHPGDLAGFPDAGDADGPLRP